MTKTVSTDESRDGADTVPHPWTLSNGMLRPDTWTVGAMEAVGAVPEFDAQAVSDSATAASPAPTSHDRRLRRSRPMPWSVR